MRETHDPQTILLIDDDTNIRKMAKRRLEQEGYRVVAAAEGHEGLELAKAERPQAILLDLMMPRMDGREVLRQLKADPETRGIPVILLTVIGPDDELYMPVQLGEVLHVSKPYQPEDLLRKIHLALSTKADESNGQTAS